MKTFWIIDINKKIATFNDDIIVYSFEFETVYDGTFEIKQKTILENNNKIDLLKLHTYMRSLGDEINLINFKKKLEFNGETDADGIRMYQIEDNIYVDEIGTICVLDTLGFEDTEFMSDININEIENTPVELAKLVIALEDDMEDDRKSNDIEYITFEKLKELLKSRM